MPEIIRLTANPANLDCLMFFELLRDNDFHLSGSCSTVACSTGHVLQIAHAVLTKYSKMYNEGLRIGRLSSTMSTIDNIVE